VNASFLWPYKCWNVGLPKFSNWCNTDFFISEGFGHCEVYPVRRIFVCEIAIGLKKVYYMFFLYVILLYYCRVLVYGPFERISVYSISFWVVQSVLFDSNSVTMSLFSRGSSPFELSSLYVSIRWLCQLKLSSRWQCPFELSCRWPYPAWIGFLLYRQMPVQLEMWSLNYLLFRWLPFSANCPIC